jgi:hypothetical protein
MLERFIFFAGIALLSTVNARQMASAAPIATQTPIPEATGTDSAVIQRAQWGRCRFWLRECAFRWDWGTWEFRRCLRRHACAD